MTGDDDLLVLAGDAALGDLRIVTPPKTEEEIAAIVRDERAERERKRIEREAKAEHVARAVASCAIRITEPSSRHQLRNDRIQLPCGARRQT